MMTTTFCDKYSFTDTFDLSRAIKNEQISDKKILDRLQEITTSQQLRSIIEQGIMAYCNSNKDFTMVSTLSKVLKNDINFAAAAGASSPDSIKKCEKSIYEKVFKIESLICHIFTYLDLKSLFNASSVNSQWLHDANKKESISCLEIGDLFSHKKVFKHLVDDEFVEECREYDTYYLMDLVRAKHEYQFQFQPRFRNLSRFANISKITLQYWWVVMASLNKKYFQQMEKLFEKIKHIRLIDPLSEECNHYDDLSNYCGSSIRRRDDDKYDIGTKIYVELALNIINKNASNIQVIEVEGDYDGRNTVSSVVEEIFSDSNNINYNHEQKEHVDVNMSDQDQDAQFESKR